MAMDSIRLFAAGFGLSPLCFITAVWKPPVASGERVVVISYVTCVYV